MDAKKNTTTTSTSTRTLTSKVTRQLTREEELVVRLSRGLGEGPEHELEFRGAVHPELSAHLALVEATLMAEMFETGPLASRASVDTEVKDRILDRLSKLSD